MDPRTLRYRERRGLLAEPVRSPSSHRAHPDDAIRRVRFIKRAQEHCGPGAGRPGRRTGRAAVNVELLLTPNCPNASAARAVLADCLRRLGLTVRVQERVGDHPSPTILVDGVDVMTRAEGTPWLPACRLDVPTTDRVMAALRGGWVSTALAEGQCP